MVKKSLIFLFSLLLCSVAFAQTTSKDAPLNIATEDGTVTTYPYKLKVTNGTLTDNGDGTDSLSTGGGSTSGFVTYAVYGIHQHDSAYPSITNFNNLETIATNNQHDVSYAKADHSHPQYATSIDTSKIANAHAVATTLATGFAPILSGNATDFLNGTGAYSVPAGGSVDTSKIANAHAEYVPYSVYGLHSHPQYQAAGSYANATHNHDTYYPNITNFTNLETIATNNQHTASYPDITNFTNLETIATNNQHNTSYPNITNFTNLETTVTNAQHDVSYAAASNTHPQYTALSIFGNHQHDVSYAAASNTHPQYTALSIFGNHQHNASYPDITNFTNLETTVTNSQHNTSYPNITNFTNLETIATNNQHNSSYADLTNFNNIKTIATTNSHSNYVPYTGAASTVNISPQHFVAAAWTSGSEFNTIQANTHVQSTTFTATGTGLSKFLSGTQVHAEFTTQHTNFSPSTGSSAFYNVAGQHFSNTTGNVSTQQGDGTVDGPKNKTAASGWVFRAMVKIKVSGQDYWVPVYDTQN